MSNIAFLIMRRMRTPLLVLLSVYTLAIVGMTLVPGQDDQGNLCGDVDMEDVLDKVSMITPVPGGVGAVTTSILATNIIKACKLKNKK